MFREGPAAPPLFMPDATAEAGMDGHDVDMKIYVHQDLKIRWYSPSVSFFFKLFSKYICKSRQKL